MNNIHQINYSSFSLLAIIRQILCNLYLFIIHLAIRNRHIRGGLRVESVLLKPVTKFLLILETAPTRTSSHVVQVPSKQRYWWGLVVIMSAFSLSYITQRSGPRSSLPISHLVAPSCCICPDEATPAGWPRGHHSVAREVCTCCCVFPEQDAAGSGGFWVGNEPI